MAVQFSGSAAPLSVVATHLALVDRTRRRQVESILSHPQLQGAVLLAGDMNSWRRCEATRTLERELVGQQPVVWPRSFPAARPVLALDRIYARGAELLEVRAHDSAAARRASDHLPGGRAHGADPVAMRALAGCSSPSRSLAGWLRHLRGRAPLRPRHARPRARRRRGGGGRPRAGDPRSCPDASEIQNHLGLAYVEAGREADALRAFQRAVALDCDNQAARQNLRAAEARAGAEAVAAP